jgi:hypothetical protein
MDRSLLWFKGRRPLRMGYVPSVHRLLERQEKRIRGREDVKNLIWLSFRDFRAIS